MRAMVAVIIPIHNREHIFRLLRELEVEADLLHVYVVHNSNTGAVFAPPEDLTVLQVTVLEPGENLGWLRGCNLGLTEAQRDPANTGFLLLNDDVRLSPGFVRGLIEASSANPSAGLMGPVYDDVWAAQRVARPLPAGLYESSPVERRVWGVDGTAMFLPRATLETVGLLDEQHFSETGWGADVDYALRVRSSGAEVLVTERAYLNHLRGQTAVNVFGEGYVGKGLQELEFGLTSKYGSRWRELLHSQPEKTGRPENLSVSLASEPHTSGPVVMVFMPTGDGALLRRFVRHHASIGVDLFLTSRAHTPPESLGDARELEKDGLLALSTAHLCEDWDECQYGLVKEAIDEHGASAVLCGRDDEFWLTTTHSISEEIYAADTDYLRIPVYNVLLNGRSRKESYVSDSGWVVGFPIEAQQPNTWVGISPVLFRQRPKLAFTTHKGALKIRNRDSQVLDPALRVADSQSIVVLRYPIRGWRQFMERVRASEGVEPSAEVGGSFSASNWPIWFRQFQAGTLASAYGLMLADSHLRQSALPGFVAPLDRFVEEFTGRLPESVPGITRGARSADGGAV